ncbi:L-methionine/branched-chain amino acid transporter [Hazenella coriacea]|uniref:Amino acid/polyamine/organocation transporter (APC superfamily) n=1 Tax=Hazenella coriacea TaxID=1179467 RepID=A0A4R3L9Q4_9BACL|nr:L-methionine/branched-chain amino acid transporter [Hazenella coriacea]TCS96439.1 amino acid/polyamine/organocation transporter (APC superfamily) [Hazenella coriacea]
MSHKPKLQQTIRLPQAIALYVGAVMGSGILLVPGLAAEIAGPASLIAWGGMVLLIVPMALVMGLLTARHPHAGGVSHFTSLAFGQTASIYVGWFFLMSVGIGAPVTALIGAGYLSSAFQWNSTGRIVISIFILLLALFINFRGMKLSGQLQVWIVLSIIGILILFIVGSIPHLDSNHLQPFMPSGWKGIGQAVSLLFWCFIGWEAISHLSEEFEKPKRDSILGVIIAAIIVGTLYFFTALSTVLTHSYGDGAGEVPLLLLMNTIFGVSGKWIIGVMSFFICTATVIAYVGAASRLAFALARDGFAPSWIRMQSSQTKTPTGGLIFLFFVFTVVILIFSSGWISLSTLIQLPNATFILTYLIGCAAGIRLLQNKWEKGISWISFIFTGALLPFVGWAIFYPILIGLLIWVAILLRKRTKRTSSTEV